MREHEAVRFLGRALQNAGVTVDYFEGEGLGEPTPDGPPLNLIGRRKSSGGGKSLLLQGHMDTVPPGDESRWTHGPWSGQIENGRRHQPFAVRLAFLNPFVGSDKFVRDFNLQQRFAARTFAVVEWPI